MSVTIPTGLQKATYVERVGNADPGASPAESFSPEYSRCTKVYDVPWSSRVVAMRDILGWAEKGTGGKIVRYIPLWHPDYTAGGQPYMWATKIERIEGIGRPSDSNFKNTTDTVATAQYSTARFTVMFETLPWNIRTDAREGSRTELDESDLKGWVIKEVKTSAQYLTMPKGTMTIVTGNYLAGNKADSTGIKLAPGKIIPNWDLRLTWKHVPESCVPSIIHNPDLQASSTLGAADTTIGRVNNAAFIGFPKGTLLLTGCAMKRFINHIGKMTYDCEYTIQYAHNSTSNTPNGHNFVPWMVNSTTLAFVEITADGSTNVSNMTAGKSIYDYADFTALFKAPT